MRCCELVLDFESYWHMGTGRGDGAIADAITLVDDAGLPMVPGRTLKGLLREAMDVATEAGVIPAARTLQWFGSGLPGYADTTDGDEWQESLEKGRLGTQSGTVWVGSAHLPLAWRQWARTQNSSSAELAELFALMHATAVDENGVAKAKTLRVMQVSIPLTLHADVRGPRDDDRWLKDLEMALPLIRAIGSHRNRGFGRVAIRLERHE